MQRLRVSIDAGAPATVWQGGAGAPVVLLHGGWAGAQAHWSTVWEGLAARHEVIAPELPGIGTGAEAGLASYDAYAAWLDRLLGALGRERAIVVGNSFGATLAWLLALCHPQRCRALVMVDGFPPPQLPAPLRALMQVGFLRAMAIRHMRRHIYGAAALASGFHDAARAPAEVRECLQRADDPRVDAMFDIVLRSRTPAARPTQPALLIWGTADRLPNADIGVGRRLHAGWPGSRLVAIDAAGHLPQVEQPQRFVEALDAFIAEHAA